QGSALGMCRGVEPSSPERAKEPDSLRFFCPFRAGASSGPCPQGAALGWRMPPLRGEETRAPANHSILKNRYTQPQTARVEEEPRLARLSSASRFVASCDPV